MKNPQILNLDSIGNPILDAARPPRPETGTGSGGATDS